MLQYAQSTSLIMPSVFPIQKGKDDRSYQVCVGGRVRRLPFTVKWQKCSGDKQSVYKNKGQEV